MKIMNLNNEVMKTINASTVLRIIQENEPISRKELADLTGLTSSSITNIVNRLINMGYLDEVGLGDSSGGRKPILLQLNPDAKFIIGVELNVDSITGIITNFKAKKVKKITVPTRQHEGKDSVLNRMVEVINQLIDSTGISKDKILGIGVAAPGPYDHINGILLDPPNFPGWFNVPIKDFIQEAVGLPVHLEKETVAAALGEYMFGGAKGIKSLFVINSMVIGLGGSAIIDGKIYHGFRDGAAEVGHMTIDIEGPKCTCGYYGCLEALASGLYMRNTAISEIKRGADSILTNVNSNVEDITVEDIVTCANQGDRLCKYIIDKTSRHLGIGIANIINLYSPEMIVIGGNLTTLCPEYVEKAVEYARSKQYPAFNKDIIIVPTSFGDEMSAIGAVSVVIDSFYKNFEVL